MWFLFINFIENAFKHGIILTGKSYININFTIDGNYLCFSVANSRSELGDEHISNTSIGITNSKRRLTLLYNNSYQLNIKESQHEFEVTLKIPI
jgi:LytS/YehU family sensor histidine kinase